MFEVDFWSINKYTVHMDINDHFTPLALFVRVTNICHKPEQRKNPIHLLRHSSQMPDQVK